MDTRLEYLPVGKIVHGERIRKDFGEIAELANDIDTFGLYHPIFVLEKGDEFLLLAGERRLTAMEMLKWTEIPCNICTKELSDWEIKVVELHENLQRKSMTPYEEAQAKAELHEVYVKIHGETTHGPTGVKGHKVEDTAKMLGESRASVSNAIQISKFAESIPEIKEAKTQSDALRMIRDLKQKWAKEELASRSEKRNFLERKSKQKNIDSIESRRVTLTERYVTGDFYEEIAKVPPRSIDLLELDPDWGIEFKEKLEKRGQLNVADYETLQPEDFAKGLDVMLKACHRVMKDNSWLIYWYSIEDWHDTSLRLLEENGFKTCKMPAFWVHDSNYTGTPAYRLAQRTESFIYARKGNTRIGKMGSPNVFQFRTARKNERGHPAEKPIELYESIISTFLGERKGAILLTGFAGSGNFLLAGDNLEQNTIGFDSSTTFRDNFVLKVQSEVPGTYKTYKENGTKATIESD